MTGTDLPGKLFDIDDRKFYLYECGEGTGPTIVLESGSTMPAALWEPVQHQVARFARVVSYDRAGYGWSSPAGRDRSGQAIVDDLHKLLQRAEIPGPYILVGHSLGGLYVRLYTARYPSEVAGMVLVDGRHEGLTRRLGHSSHRSQIWSRTMLVPLCALGVLRAAVGRNPAMLTGGRFNWLSHFPAERHEAILGTMYSLKLALAALREWKQLAETEEILGRAPSLGDLPVVVLSRTLPELQGWGYSEETKAFMWQAWVEAQGALAGLSSRSRHVAVPDSGHMIYIEQPEVVVQAIREVLEDAASSMAASR